MMPSDTIDPFVAAFQGGFTSVMRWPQLAPFWSAVQTSGSNDWYIYAVGETPPETPASNAALANFLARMDQLLRKEHDEDYCGIVYADDLKTPGFVKIFDPNNLGVSCGFSDSPPLPGWILSKIAPCDLPTATQPTGSRRRWWNKLFD